MDFLHDMLIKARFQRSHRIMADAAEPERKSF